MMSLMHKVCSTLLLLSAFAFNAHADTLPNHMKDASELTAGIVKAARPNVLLCILPSVPGADMGDIIGKVTPGSDPDSFVCEYTQFINDVAMGPYVTTDFQWLNATYEQLASWLTSLAHIEKSDKGHYYVLRCSEHNPDHPPAICAQSTSSKGFEFGYETVSDNGHKSCGTFVGAVYTSPFFDVALAGWNECTGKTFSPECHQCNGDGCGAFHCSAFTTWDKCPKGSHLCGYQTCVGNLCSQKPICEWDK